MALRKKYNVALPLVTSYMNTKEQIISYFKLVCKVPDFKLLMNWSKLTEPACKVQMIIAN